MKTRIEYEASDIHISKEEGESDPVHLFLLTQVMVMMLKAIDMKQGPAEDPLLPMKEVVADFLNRAQEKNISITVAEKVPDVYRDV